MEIDKETLPFVGSKALPLEASGKILLTTNVLAIVLAIVFQYDFAVVIWSYWLESVVIGVFTFLGLVLTGMRAKEMLGKGAALSYAGFFAVHYGFFHFVYLFFLVFMGIFYLDSADYIWVLVTVVLLVLSHGFSFVFNTLMGRERREVAMDSPKAAMKELEAQMVKPYSRIVPIHLTIIISGFFMPLALFAGPIVTVPLLAVFMTLKTYGDLWLHNLKHSGKDFFSPPESMIKKQAQT